MNIRHAWKTIKYRTEWALTSRQKRAQKMADLKSVLSLYTPTHVLLEMAREKNITIKFDPALIATTSSGYFSAKENKIVLDPYFATSSDLAHELRHMWQYHVLNIHKDQWMDFDYQTPKESILLTRVLEADAHAFQYTFEGVLSYINKGLEKITPAIEAHKKTGNKAPLAVQVDQEPLDIVKDMQDNFIKASRKMSALYDYDSIVDFVVPVYDAKGNQNNPVPSLTTLRHIFQLSVADQNTNYLSHMTDQELILTLWSPVEKEARHLAKLTARFKSAVDRGMTGGQKEDAYDLICEKLHNRFSMLENEFLSPRG